MPQSSLNQFLFKCDPNQLKPTSTLLPFWDLKLYPPSSPLVPHGWQVLDLERNIVKDSEHPRVEGNTSIVGPALFLSRVQDRGNPEMHLPFDCPLLEINHPTFGNLDRAK